MAFEYGSCDGNCDEDVDLITKKKRKAYKYMNDIELYLLKRATMRWRSNLMLMSGCLSACAMSVPVFSYGAMIPYIYSYLWMNGERFDMRHLNLHPSLFLIFVTCCGSLIGLLSKFCNERVLYAIFSVGLTLVMTSIYWFGKTYVSLSLYMCALGFFGGNVLVFTIGKATEWNPSKSGAANGIIGFFIGMSGFIGSFICTLYVNPGNIGMDRVTDPLYPELGNVTIFMSSNVYMKVPYLWIIFAGMFATLLIPSILFVRSPTPEEVCEMIPLTDDSEDDHKAIKSEKDYSVRQMLGSFKFYFLYIIVMTMSLALLSSSELYKEIAKETILDDHFLNVTGAVLAIANAFGRLLWGIFMDRAGARLSLFLAFLMITPSTITLYWSRHFPWLYLFNVCCLSFSSGIFTGVAPALVELFGARDISLKYSVCLSGEMFGCALFYILSVGSVKIYNELVFLCLLAAPCGLSCILAIIFI
ncbi:uncharacterized protein LOC134821738 isoform X2 [Bolinopsis microptera]|uniref:uncharacterized protein LOC134821738 isoform X2 n=1 Tax=Bolinopsis microptera TaxID=2820187 RepID=UPI0030797D83